MRFDRWPIWFACGLLLALFVVSQLAAQSPGPSMQSVGAVCPLSDEQTQKATTAFDQMAVTFTTEPRCVNCHGGVDPFGPDADKTHAGGRLSPIFKTVPILNLIGINIATDEVDTAATNDQCQECHSELPGWKLAPAQDVFKGQTAIKLCANQKVVFGRLLKTGPSGFANHIEHDVKDVPFIDNAFMGTRGLNDFGQTQATGPFPDPPKNVTHAQLNMLARQWADALGSKFQGDEECGCVPHHYALLLEEKVDTNSNVAGATVILHAAGQVQIPITFKNDGSFTGSGMYKRTLDETIQAPNALCTGRTTPQTATWTLSGSVDGSDVDNPGVLHVKMKTHTTDVTLNLTCRTGTRSTSQSSAIQGGDGSGDMPDTPALVGQTNDNSVPVTGLGGSSTVKITVVQLD